MGLAAYHKAQGSRVCSLPGHAQALSLNCLLAPLPSRPWLRVLGGETPAGTRKPRSTILPRGYLHCGGQSAESVLPKGCLKPFS